MDAASFYLVVESSQTVREALCHVLLSFGIQGIPVPSRAAALKTLAEAEKIEGAVIDIDNTDVDGIALISELKQDERTRGMAIIVHTVQSSKEFVLRMVELGVVGYLLKPFSPDTAKAKLAAIFAKTAGHNSQRRHIRVQPDPGELVRVSFRVSHPPRLVSGRIVDISLGGLAVELFNPPAPEELPPGTPIARLEFSVSGKELKPSASVVVYKSKILALRFENIFSADKSALERYIFKSISS
ncbi:MAG: response regulator [Spirochaetia bacterium]|jgi:CheY-like chemotaxis protein